MINEKLNIIIVDDNKAFLKGLSSFIQKINEFNLIAQFQSGQELLEYSRIGIADIILLDIEMPEMNGIEAARIINYDYPRAKIIAITMYQDKIYLQQLIEAGFHGFVNKASVPEKLIETIHNVNANKFLFPENLNI